MTTMHNFAQLRMQGISDPAHSMMNKGGGGSAPSNPDTRYANLDALYGTQNQASQFMLDNAMPYIPKLTENSAGMVDEAMSGLLSQRARNIAGADAEQSFSSNMAAIDRNLGKYGAEFNGNRMSALNRNAATEGALAKATAMNKASQWGEDQKWNRNASFYGQVMGMNNGAMQGLSSAGAGLSNIANQQNANDAANAKGYGQAGAAFSNALFKADGGEVRAPRLAAGGNAWEAYKAANPVTPMVTGGMSRRGRTNPYMAMLSGAAPQMLGAGLKDVLNLDGKGGKIAGGLKKGYNWLDGKYTASSAPQNTGVSSLQFESDPNVVAGNVDYSTVGAGADATMAATELGSAASAISAGGDIAPAAYDTLMAADTVNAMTSTADAAAIASDINSAGLGGFARGGLVKPKRAQGLALGGMPSMQKMSVADNANVAGLDSNQSMSVARMGTTPTKQQNAKPTGNAPGYYGNTDGNGEMSYGDEDGFGKYHGDYRHLAGKGVMSYFIPAGGLLAEVVHPLGEAVSRGMVNTGSNITGSSAGAMVMDPIATTMSGKYTPQQIATDGARENAKIASGASFLAGDPIMGTIAGKIGGLFSQGGDVEPALRKDFRPGGKVTGPGTETSDDIPAWLSQGEYVLNAEAVKMVGKKKLDKINEKGLEKRGDKPGLEHADSGAPKLALGGNIGIAMGAGVDQFNRQQMIDQRDQEIELRRQAMAQQQLEAARRQEEYDYQKAQREAGAQAQSAARGHMGNISAMSGLPDQLRARVAAGEITQDEANNALRAYNSAGYTPTGLAKQAGLEMARVDLGKGMELENKLLAQQKADKMARIGSMLGKGDYAGLAGAMTDNEFNPDGKSYKFVGVDKAKDGNEYVKFNMNGVEQRVDKRLLPGLAEAAIDPTKGIEYTREAGKITDQDADRKLRAQQIGISGGHLGLAQQKWNEELSQIKTEKQAKAAISKLREDLSNTTDEAARAVIKQKIEDLAGSGKSDYRYHSTQGEDGDGRKVVNVLDRSTGVVYEGGVQRGGGAKSQQSQPAQRIKLPAGAKIGEGTHTDKNGNKIKVYADGTYEKLN